MIQQTGRHRDPDKFGNPGLIPGSLFCLRKCKLKGSGALAIGEGMFSQSVV